MSKKTLAYRNITQADVKYRVILKELALLDEAKVQELPLDFIAILTANHLKFLGYDFVSKLTAQQLGTIVISRLCVLPIEDLKKLYNKFKDDKTKTFEIKIVKIKDEPETVTLKTGLISSKLSKAIKKNKNRQQFTSDGLKLDLTKERFTKEDLADYFRYPNLYGKEIIMNLFKNNDSISREELLALVNQLYNGKEELKELPRLYSLNDLEIMYKVSSHLIYNRIYHSEFPYVSFSENRSRPLVTDEIKDKIFEIKQIA